VVNKSDRRDPFYQSIPVKLSEQEGRVLTGLESENVLKEAFLERLHKFNESHLARVKLNSMFLESVPNVAIMIVDGSVETTPSSDSSPSSPYPSSDSVDSLESLSDKLNAFLFNKSQEEIQSVEVKSWQGLQLSELRGDASGLKDATVDNHFEQQLCDLHNYVMNRRVLLSRNRYKDPRYLTWSACGFRQLGEPVEAAARRELKEELHVTFRSFEMRFRIRPPTELFIISNAIDSSIPII